MKLEEWFMKKHAKRKKKLCKVAKKAKEFWDGYIYTQEDESRYFELMEALNYFINEEENHIIKNKVAYMLDNAIVSSKNNFWD